MDTPRSKEIPLFGGTYDLKLTAGNFRLAQLRGKSIDPSALNSGERGDFDVGCQLAYIALLPSLPDNKTEEDVVEEMIENEVATDAAQHCLAQYLEMQGELKKFLRERSQMASDEDS